MQANELPQNPPPNLVRAYINIKTHLTAAGLRLTGKKLQDRKDGFAEWQLVEEQV
jgi:hypothetical protein